MASKSSRDAYWNVHIMMVDKIMFLICVEYFILGKWRTTHCITFLRCIRMSSTAGRYLRNVLRWVMSYFFLCVATQFSGCDGWLNVIFGRFWCLYVSARAILCSADDWYAPYLHRAGLLLLTILVKDGLPKMDNATRTTLADRWRPETHIFHPPSGEMTVTLQVVGMLFGLRIER